MFNKKPKQPLTEQEEKIKQYRKKTMKSTMIIFSFTVGFTIMGLLFYNIGYVNAGTFLIGLMSVYPVVIILFIVDLSRVNTYAMKVYFESLKPKDQ